MKTDSLSTVELIMQIDVEDIVIGGHVNTVELTKVINLLITDLNKATLEICQLKNPRVKL